jgi:hypothetical protein
LEPSCFFEGLTQIKDNNEKFGYIDKTGKVVISCKWSLACRFLNGYAEVQDEDGNGFVIDKNGNVIKSV